MVNSGEEKWIPSDLNQGHLAKFFLLLASVVGANLVAFVIIARRFDTEA